MEKNLKLAIQWYTKALAYPITTRGVTEAHHAVANAYLDGLGINMQVTYLS